MRRGVWSLVTIVATAMLILLMLVSSAERATEAEFVRVERADVHQVVPIYGQLRYEDEQVITAVTSGTAKRVCVKAGDRVGTDAALIRMDSPIIDRAISAFAAASDAFPDDLSDQPIQQVVRSEKACTVRQVYVEEGTMVSAGMPLLRVSSHAQRVVCLAAPLDAARISLGMWAWLSSEGEALCLSTVESVGEPVIDIKTGYEVNEIVLIPEKAVELEEYALIDADIYIAGSDDVLSLPLNAITDRSTVWWVNEERCTEIPAQVVMTDEMRAWVQLPEGMTVAIGEFVEGQKVKEGCP